MQIDENSKKFILFNQIKNNFELSFCKAARVKLNEIKNKNNSSINFIEDLIKLIEEPEKLLSTEFNDRINFFYEPTTDHELVEPIRNRIELFREYSNKHAEIEDIKEIIDNLIIPGYIDSIQHFINDAINYRDENNRMDIYQKKVCLVSEDLEFRNVDLNYAYERIGYDPNEFEFVNSNKSSFILGRQLDGVYYKVDNGTKLLHPAKEDAAYRFYCDLYGMDQQLIPPTQLLLIYNIPINLWENSSLRKQIHDIKSQHGFKSTKEVFSIHPELLKKIKSTMKLETVSLQSSLFIEGTSFQRFLEDLKMQELNQQSLFLEESIDLNSYSSHILASLLLIQTNYKPDNLILDTKTKQIIGIDNDSCLESDEFEIFKSGYIIQIKNVLYTLSTLMNKPIESNAVDRFVSHVPEYFILNWLFQLYEKEIIFNKMFEEMIYYKMVQNSVKPHFTKLTIEERPVSNIRDSLGLPLKFPDGLINSILNRFTKIKKILIENKQTTHQQLFNEIHPLASVYYESVATKYSNPLDQISSMYLQNFIDSNINMKHNNESLFEELSKTSFIHSHPTISIKDSIIDFFSNIKVDTLHSNHQVFIDIVKLLIKISKEIKFSFSFERSWYTTVHKSILLFIKHGVEKDIIKEFISLLHNGKRKGNNNSSIIHSFLLSSFKDNLDEEFIINRLSIINSIGGIDFDIVENGKSPLDIIAINSIGNGGGVNGKNETSIDLFKHFVLKLGAGKTCIDSNINRYYSSLSIQQKHELIESIEKLSRINPKVGWSLSLNHLFPLIDPSITYDSNKLLLTSTRGNRIINDDQWNQLFDNHNKPIKSNEQFGKSIVPIIQDLECGHIIYIKFEPQFPGTELAVSLLGQQLFGYISPFTELAMINGIPVLLIQEIKGVTLYQFIQNDLPKLSLLDPSNISKIIVFDMLINNADANFTNYIINDDGSNGTRFKMYLIDTDQSFVLPVLKRTGLFSTKLSIEVKTCTFLLDQMDAVVHQDVIECIKDIDVELEIKKWLDSLNVYNYQWIEFFKRNQIKTTNFSNPENFTLAKVSFLPNQIKSLYLKIYKLVNLFRKSKPITHIQLLEFIEPLVANNYRSVIKLFPDKNSIYIRYYYFENQNLLGSLTNSSPRKINNQLIHSNFGPNHGLVELNEIHAQHTEFLKILKDLLSSNFYKNFNIQKLTSIDNLTDALFEEFLKESDFSFYSTTHQILIFNLIKSKELVNLYIQRSISFKTATLNSLNFKSLSVLNLSHCQSLQSFANNGLILKGPIYLPCLNKLELDHCTGLKEILLVADNLIYFSASHCSSLGPKFRLESPDIKYLNLSNGSLSLLSNLLHLQTLAYLYCIDISNNSLTSHNHIESVTLSTKELIKDNIYNFPNLINHFNKENENDCIQVRDFYYKGDNYHSSKVLFHAANEDAVYRFYCDLYGVDQQLISPTQLLLFCQIPIIRLFSNKSKQFQLGILSLIETDLNVRDTTKIGAIPTQSSLVIDGTPFQSFLEDLEKQKLNQQSLFLEESIDLNSYSSHILSSLLIQTDCRPENLILHRKTKQIIAIENGDCLKSDQLVKNVLFTLSTLMNKPLESNSVDKFISHVPEYFILNWLFQLYEKELIYYKMVEESNNFIVQSKVGRNIKLNFYLPLRFPVGYVNSMFNRFTKIKKILIENKQTTHEQLFNEIHFYGALSTGIWDLFHQIKSLPCLSIKQSIIDFFSNIKVDNLHSNHQVFIDMVMLLIKISNEIKFITGFTFEKSWYTTVQKSMESII